MAGIERKFAAQLYTVRDQLKADFPGVLWKLKEQGWAGVQISGLHGYDAREISEVLQGTGLKTAGMHVSLQELTSDLPSVLEQARFFETRDLVCPYLSQEYQNEAGYRDVRRTLNDIADKVSKDGYRVSYHNHAFEFGTTVDGDNALRYLISPGGGNQVLAEVDVYWVKKGGQDPVEFIQPYTNRMPIIHLKDMTNDDKQAFAEIGTGSIDFIPILQWGEANGVEWYAVEQDVCPGDPLESLKLSLTNLRQLAQQLA